MTTPKTLRHTPTPEEYTDEDMAAVGRAFMEAIAGARTSDAWVRDWSPLQCPSEIIFDLLNRRDSHEQLTARVAELEGVLRKALVLEYYINNPSAWEDGYDEGMSERIRPVVESARASLTRGTGG